MRNQSNCFCKLTHFIQSITMIFGLIAILTGFFGVIIGGFWAQIWRRTNARADPLVCAISAFAGVPFIFCALTTLETSMVAGYVRLIHHYFFSVCFQIFIFFGMLFLCFNWSIISDMLMVSLARFHYSNSWFSIQSYRLVVQLQCPCKYSSHLHLATSSVQS